MSKAKCIMVQGTMSGAGKSLLCAALCRIFAQDGYRVAPFKSQNMALNSFVTRNGAEMGRAQVVQAQAAGVEPDVRMNPILLKPSSDVGSQVIVNGKARGQMPAAAYFKMKRSLIPDILEAYNSLAAENDIIVIEGAGSPAEINLKADDIVNMGLAKLVDAPVLLAGDIDRGGVFAQLYGTVELLEADERARIRGLIINKFRGDVEMNDLQTDASTELYQALEEYLGKKLYLPCINQDTFDAGGQDVVLQFGSDDEAKVWLAFYADSRICLVNGKKAYVFPGGKAVYQEIEEILASVSTYTAVTVTAIDEKNDFLMAEEKNGKLYAFHKVSEKLRTKSGKQAKLEDLAVGDELTVLSDGRVLLSDPYQIENIYQIYT